MVLQHPNSRLKPVSFCSKPDLHLSWLNCQQKLYVAIQSGLFLIVLRTTRPWVSDTRIVPVLTRSFFALPRYILLITK